MTSGQAGRPAPFVAGERLEDVDVVFRRLSDSGPSMVYQDPITGARRPTSGAFKPDSDGVSVYSERALLVLGASPVDLLVRSGNLLVRLAVAGVRGVDDLDVLADPWPPDVPDPDHVRNGAHALIVGLQSSSLTKGQRKRLQSALVELAEFTEFTR